MRWFVIPFGLVSAIALFALWQVGAPWPTVVANELLLAVLFGALAIVGSRGVARGWSVARIALAAEALALLLVPVVVLLDPPIADEPSRSAAEVAFSTLWTITGLIGIWVLLTLLPSVSAAKRQREAQIVQLERDIERAQLRAGIEPHFLRNTLNSISALVTQSPNEARRLIAVLGDLLTSAFDAGETESVATQLAWMRAYMTLLQARFPGLSSDITAAHDVEAMIMPRFLLQPVIENAVNHGALLRSDHAGRVIVEVRCEAAQVVALIRDNGPNAPVPGAGGRGLGYVRRQLELIGGKFELERSAEWTVARMAFPIASVTQEPR